MSIDRQQLLNRLGSIDTYKDYARTMIGAGGAIAVGFVAVTLFTGGAAIPALGIVGSLLVAAVSAGLSLYAGHKHKQYIAEEVNLLAQLNSPDTTHNKVAAAAPEIPEVATPNFTARLNSPSNEQGRAR